MNGKENITLIGDHGQETNPGVVILFLSFSVLATCLCKIVLSKILKNKIPIPFTVAVLILGFIIGIITVHIKTIDNNLLRGEMQLSEINPHLIYYIFLPLLIFDSSFNGHFHIVKQQLLSAILLAGPGVLISTGIIAICSIYIFPYNWSWLVGLLFGSILSATDPIAIVALLHDSGASKSLASLIDSESLLNDGSAFVIFLIFKNIVVGGHHSAKTIIIDIVKYTIGGPAFGFGCGLICVIILNRINNELEVEIAFTFAIAYLVFFVADVELGVSAVLALVAMGLYMAKNKYCISSNVQLPMASAWQIATYLINILIFTITGIILAKAFVGTASTITPQDFGLSIVLYVIIHIGRALTIVVLYPLISRTGVHLSWKDCIILIWSGLRGSMALILVLIVDLDTRIDTVTRDHFLFHVSMIVLLTLVINGTSSKFLVKFIGLNRGTKESQIILLQALEHMRRDTSDQLSQMKQNETFTDVDWKMLGEYLPEKLLEELDEEQNTDIHRQFSRSSEPDTQQSSQPEITNTDLELPTIPTIHQTDSISNDPIQQQKASTADDAAMLMIEAKDTGDKHRQNVRNELVIRFLTAMSIDYEKQWYLGMIRRRTLDILIKSVEQAKQKCSLKLHWQLLVEHFQLSIFLLNLIRFDYCDFINKWTNNLLFNHIFLTIELTLGFHSAETRMDNIPVLFPELAKIDEQIMNEVCEEAKMYQFNAKRVLLDLQQSYRLCWIIQMTKRCAQMLLKHESISIIHLYETGMLDENEYSHIRELIEKKLFTLEYGTIQMPIGRKKAIENPFDLLSLFQILSENEKIYWKSIMKPKHKWFQPGAILLQKYRTVSTAYLIIRGIVECTDDTLSTYYISGNIVGIDALFSRNLLSHGIYSANDGLVEAYAIDSNLLNILLVDDKLSRSIYNEIALHMLVNTYQTRFKLNHLQLKSLLDEKAILYRNKSNFSIFLQANERLFLLAGTIISHSDQKDIRLDSTQFVLLDSPATYSLNLSSIVYIWTDDDEIDCLNGKKYKLNFPTDNSETTSVNLFYPHYSGDTTEFTPRRQSLNLTPPMENLSHLQFIPSEIDINTEFNIPLGHPQI